MANAFSYWTLPLLVCNDMVELRYVLQSLTYRVLERVQTQARTIQQSMRSGKVVTLV